MNKEQEKRIAYAPYKDLICTAEDAAKMIEDQETVGASGFTKAGESKVVLPAFAKRSEKEDVKINLITGASLGYGVDGDLAESGALMKRMPFQADPVLRKSINAHETLYIDQHLSETAEQLENGHLPKIDTAIVEVCAIDEKGNLYPTTSIGNTTTFLKQADKIIIEVNTTVPLGFEGIADVYSHEAYPHRKPINIVGPKDRIGSPVFEIDPSKVVAVVFSDVPDGAASIADPDEATIAISKHIMDFLDKEVEAGRLGKELPPLQAGIGKVANAVMMGFNDSQFENLTMYSEVLQDSTFEMFDSGKMAFACATSLTVSDEWREKIYANFDQYKDKMLLRPQNISNAAEVIRRLGIIAINTAIEFDIYGNVNSTHIGGSNMMNGIGGSGDFARNSYMSIFVCNSSGKKGSISRVVPMVSHVDHCEHDVDILVTEQGLADLRGLSPVERAQAIIENCAHPDYKALLQHYFAESYNKGGHTPHMLEHAFDWHVALKEHGTMRVDKVREAESQNIYTFIRRRLG